MGQSLGSVVSLRQELSPQLQSTEGEPRTLNPDALQVLEHAAEEATQLGHQKVGTGHLLRALRRTEGSFLAAYLARHGIELPSARDTLPGMDFA